MIPFTHWRAMDKMIQGRCETSNPAGTKTVTFHRGNITIRLTCNEPSTASLENFRVALYEILSRMFDR
ncbi:hypothetical protein JZ785_03700 [Alicyclobacillus curvatus]|nr:hypothetical protein JZ785_03700 [Alicyclobacillus curvatus]